MDFYNDRRPTARREDDDARPLDRASLKDANSRIRSAAPAYQVENVNRKIRTVAVQRHRGRRAGQADFSTVGAYVDFITGTDDGSE